jgi:CBS domain-containing protein
VPGETPIDDLIRMSVANRSPIPVVDIEGRYLGAVTRTALLSKLCRGGIQ